MRITITTNQILELLKLARQGRAQQANISQKTEIESQDRKDNKSKESQNNQPVKVNLEAEDTDKQRLPAENAQLQSQNQNQDDITGTDMTLRPCAKGEQQRRVAGEPDCLGTSPLFPRISDGEEGSAVERTRDIRQGIGDSQLNDAGRRAITISTILAGSGVKMKAVTASSDVPFAQEQLCTSGLEELMEELTEEPRVGSVGQQKENFVDLSSVITTTTTSEEPREINPGPDFDHDQMRDFDDIHALLDAISLTTIDDAKGINSSEPGRDQSRYLPDSSWGHAPNITNITMWTSFDKKATTDFVVGHENLAGLLPTRSGRGLGCGSDTVDIQGKFEEEEQSFLSTSPESFDFKELPPDVSHLVEPLPPSLQEEQLLLADSIPPASQEEQPGITSHDFQSMEKTESGAAGTLAQEELCAPTRTPDASNIENYNNNYHCSIVSSVIIDADIDEGEVDEDPPTRSKYDQINKDESITIMEVIAGTDVKKKDDTVIVATEGDTHGKIIGYNCGDYSDCDYWDEYDIRDENMEIESGTRLPSASYLSPCKALLRAGDFVFTGQPPGG